MSATQASSDHVEDRSRHHELEKQTPAVIIAEDVVVPGSEEMYDRMTAQIRATNLSFTSWASVQIYMFMFVAYCNSWGTGYDSAIMSAMNSNDRWHSDLGVPKSGGFLGIVTAIYTIGNLAGSFFAGPASDRWGRRVGMFIGAMITLMGAIVLSTAQNSQAYMAGRFFSGFGVAIGRSAAPAFVTEMSPPQWRGPITLLYNSIWLIGAIISGGVAYATGPMDSSLSWRLPLVIQAVPSSIVLLTCLFLPESPRWLVANERYEEAEALLVKYHADGVSNSPLVALEMAEMRQSIKAEASDKRWYDYSELISSRSNRYRTFLVVSMACIGQWGGSNLTGYYQANILRSIGITAQSDLLTYNLTYYVAAFGGATVGSLVSDKVGRRKLLIFGCLAMCACLIGLTACTSQFHTGQPLSVSNLTLAFIFFVGIFHSGGINPLVVAYPVECLHTNTRSKGMGLNNFSLNIAEFVNTYGTSIGLQRIGWRIYIIYIFWNVIQAVWIYVFFVETKGHTLEELDRIFESKRPVKESLRSAHRIAPASGEEVKTVT